jgi:hypothetical protein
MKKIIGIPPKVGADDWTFSDLKAKIFKWLIIILAVVLLLLVLQILTFYGVFEYFESKVRIFTGYDTFIVKGISFLLLALFFGTPIGGLAWSFLPFPQKNKRRKRFILLAILALFCFILFFTSSGVYFNPNDGKPMKYYSIQANGEYKFYYQEGYDPTTGDELKPVNKVVMARYLRKESNSSLSNGNNLKESSLIGAEKDSNFYPVEFKNETGRNIYLCFSSTSNPDNFLLYRRILEGESINLSLMEGNHFFAYMDVNGRCFGQRFGGKTLTSSDVPIRIVINKQSYLLRNTFLLDVLASNNQVITMKEDIIKHNNDYDSKDEDANGIVLFIIASIFSLFIILMLIAANNR